MIHYDIWLEEPTLRRYGRSYSPREDYALAGMWVGAVLSGASGRWYHGMRGFDELAADRAHTYMFMELHPGDLHQLPANLYKELPVDQVERYEYRETEQKLTFAGKHVDVDVYDEGFRWSDAGGRFRLDVEHLGAACVFWVPEQEGIDHPIQHRSQIGRAVGEIDGDPVEGFTFLDWSYSHAGLRYFDLPLICKLEKQWSMWFVEYSDGELDAGFVWKGRGDTGFRASHLIINGESQAIAQGVTDTTYDERGTVLRTHLEVGDQVIELEQTSCADWPAHTFGPVKSTSRSVGGKTIAKSWNYCEWMPDNTEALFSRYFAGELVVTNWTRGAIVNESLVFRGDPEYPESV